MVNTLTTPPVGRQARMEAGFLLRRLQRDERIGLPGSRPLSSIGPRVHELRVRDRETRRSWRIIYRVDSDAVLVVHWFWKATRALPQRVVDLCQRRLAEYDRG